MEGHITERLHRKIVDSLSSPIPDFTRRDIHLPAIKNKAFAVIGMRRSGKTTFLWQCLADRLKAGAPRESLLYLNFEDEQLIGLNASHLEEIVETYYRLYPDWRNTSRVTFFLDEIQLVSGWETFARRLLDTEKIDLFLSGSSARLLSREVATSMRGRALEVLVHPFSFEESLRHNHHTPKHPFEKLGKAARSHLESHLVRYLTQGGFPEAQGASDKDRTMLLKNYVDVAILRDVIERHAVKNPLALRAMQRHILGNAAAAFSVHKFSNTLKSQGLAVAKDTLHAYLNYLEDTFLIRTVSIHTRSERQRLVNARKAYPIDPGLIPIYTHSDETNVGHALETAVLIELERRGKEVTYIRTEDGYEVDFCYRDDGGRTILLQVCARARDQATHDREIRALSAAATLYPKAIPTLITLDAMPPPYPRPKSMAWQPAAAWFLKSGNMSI